MRIIDIHTHAWPDAVAAKAVDALKMFLSLAPDAPESAKARELVAKLC